MLEQGRQVMVFVHSRKDTVNTAFTVKELLNEDGRSELLELGEEIATSAIYLQAKRDVEKSKNRDVKDLFPFAIGIHHAGMLRNDRTLIERQFERGHLKVLVCTATLAWGVNLPAYCVIIKGTQVYDAQKGGFVDLSILDVLQIFGRAGRPQFEPSGLGILITTHDKLYHYISHIASQKPIESTFAQHLVDNLNAEISCTGTVSNLNEAIQWLGYTFLHVRMRKNPLVYGLEAWDPALDPALAQHRRALCLSALKSLVAAQMVVFDASSGIVTAKDLGRIAASYYLSKDSVEVFNQSLHARCSEADILAVVSCSHEFDSIKMREEESQEMRRLSKNCPCEIKVCF